MKQIAILSDTHGLLRDHVIFELIEADCCIHAGDWKDYLKEKYN